jgi:bacillolysin
MKKNYFLIVMLSLAIMPMAIAQKKAKKLQPAGQTETNLPAIPTTLQSGTPDESRNPFERPVSFRTITNFVGNINLPEGVQLIAADNNLPTMVKGELRNAAGADVNARVAQYLQALQPAMQIKNSADEFVEYNRQTDDLGITHVRMQQTWSGYKVWGAQIVVHEQNGKVNRMNGRYFPTPTLDLTQANISEPQAIQIAKADVETKIKFQTLDAYTKKLIGGEQIRSEMVVLYLNGDKNQEFLAYHVTVIPHTMSKMEYFLDARTGAILNKYNAVCDFFGALAVTGLDKKEALKRISEEQSPSNSIASDKLISTTSALVDGVSTASAVDLKGITRTLNTYVSSNENFLLDGSRTMFRFTTALPDDPTGAILTLDAFNTSPSGRFNYDHVSPRNNNWVLTSPKAVSAHFNSGTAYDYYKNTFNRNSINGRGGTIISLINVSDDNGGGMDNAFWNGEAMFYGNGASYFTPLAKALDVGGHEMSHGVIQNTANLDYQGESGAMNESYADIFGAMIDRANWTMGEDVVRAQYFPTGALRDLANPHNGGARLGDNGWQPNNTSEQYSGTQDNGGVHINSGIPNYAYYLFANASGVGKAIAEKIYYRALDHYLVTSSKFIDLRAAVLASAQELYPGNTTISNAAANAFTTVGIGSGGSSTGTTYQQDIPVNPGADWILYSASDSTKIFVAKADFSNTPVVLSNTKHISKPSISDNGSEVVFVGADNKIHYIPINWAAGTVGTESIFGANQNQTWSNVVISKDGSKLAANTIFADSAIFVYTDQTQNWKKFRLYSPTYTQGISTGTTTFSDALEWDHTSQYVVYDSYNVLRGARNQNLDYYDVAFIKVWENGAGGYWDRGTIQKLFASLPTNTQVVNPTYAKNSPYILGFDYVDNNQSTNGNTTYGANIQTGDLDTIALVNTLGYPSFARLDDRVIYNSYSGATPTIRSVPLASNKIRQGAAPTLLRNNATLGTWFANQTRRLLEVQDLSKGEVKVYPNPFSDILSLSFEGTLNGEGKVQLFDMLGKEVYMTTVNVQSGKNTLQLNAPNLGKGAYILRITVQDRSLSQKLMKM